MLHNKYWNLFTHFFTCTALAGQLLGCCEDSDPAKGDQFHTVRAVADECLSNCHAQVVQAASCPPNPSAQTYIECEDGCNFVTTVTYDRCGDLFFNMNLCQATTDAWECVPWGANPLGCNSERDAWVRCQAASVAF